jgi:hypothetical protein
MYAFYRSQGNIAMVFFPLIYIAMNLIMLNLFLAILLSNFDNISEDRQEQREALSANKKLNATFKGIQKRLDCCQIYKKAKFLGIADGDQSSEDEIDDGMLKEYMQMNTMVNNL